MSEPTNIDFEKGLDMTGVNPATAANFNTLIDAAQPYSEVDPIEGKGLSIVTRNNADDSPCVPDPTVNANWKRYFWVRVKYNEDGARIVYKWNDSLTPDATYLKWEEFGSTTSVQAEIDALDADVLALQSAQANLSNQLNAVSGVANSAQADATEALNSIPDVTALTEAITVTLPAADTANAAAAAAAQSTANTANTNANNALTQSNAVANSRFFTSADVPVTGATEGTLILNAAHLLGAAPHFVKAVMVCTTIDNGYAVGDEVDVDAFYAGSFSAFAVASNATNVFVTQRAAAPSITVKTTGAGNGIASGSWSLRVYAWKG